MDCLLFSYSDETLPEKSLRNSEEKLLLVSHAYNGMDRDMIKSSFNDLESDSCFNVIYWSASVCLFFHKPTLLCKKGQVFLVLQKGREFPCGCVLFQVVYSVFRLHELFIA